MNYAGSPQFCAIAPILYSPLVAGRKAHLVLAHLVDIDHAKNELERAASVEYTRFIQQESTAGAFVMMDCSAYELKVPYAPDKLIELATKCGAHAIVLPDYPFQESSVTIAAAEKFAPLFKEAGFKTFFVPQSKTGDVRDWVTAYSWAAQNELIDIIGISILGVPNAWNKIEPAFARVVAMQTLVDLNIYNPEKHHHFLGLNAGPALEVPSLLRMGVLDTIDSSGPVWAAKSGHRYSVDCDSYQAVRKLTDPVDFYAPKPKDAATIERIHHNVKLTDDLFTGNNNVKVWYAVE